MLRPARPVANGPSGAAHAIRVGFIVDRGVARRPVSDQGDRSESLDREPGPGGRRSGAIPPWSPAHAESSEPPYPVSFNRRVQASSTPPNLGRRSPSNPEASVFGRFPKIHVLRGKPVLANSAWLPKGAGQYRGPLDGSGSSFLRLEEPRGTVGMAVDNSDGGDTEGMVSGRPGPSRVAPARKR